MWSFLIPFLQAQLELSLSRCDLFLQNIVIFFVFVFETGIAGVEDGERPEK